MMKLAAALTVMLACIGCAQPLKVEQKKVSGLVVPGDCPAKSIMVRMSYYDDPTSNRDVVFFMAPGPVQRCLPAEPELVKTAKPGAVVTLGPGRSNVFGVLAIHKPAS